MNHFVGMIILLNVYKKKKNGKYNFSVFGGHRSQTLTTPVLACVYNSYSDYFFTHTRSCSVITKTKTFLDVHFRVA